MPSNIVEEELEHHERFYKERNGRVSLIWRTADELLFKRYLENVDGKRIVEIGCGDGTGIKWLRDNCGMRDFDYTGFDVSPTAIEQAHHIFPYGSFDLYDCTQGLPFSNGTIDAILSLGVLHHIHNEYRNVLEDCLRVLKPNGLLLIREPTSAMKQGNGESPYECGFDTFKFVEDVWKLDGEVVKFGTFDHRITTPLRVLCKFVNNPSLFRLERKLELRLDRSFLGAYGITKGLDFAMVVRKKC